MVSSRIIRSAAFVFKEAPFVRLPVKATFSLRPVTILTDRPAYLSYPAGRDCQDDSDGQPAGTGEADFELL
jgi:hypothetical protein